MRRFRKCEVHIHVIPRFGVKVSNATYVARFLGITHHGSMTKKFPPLSAWAANTTPLFTVPSSANAKNGLPGPQCGEHIGIDSSPFWTSSITTQCEESVFPKNVMQNKQFSIASLFNQLQTVAFDHLNRQPLRPLEIGKGSLKYILLLILEMNTIHPAGLRFGPNDSRPMSAKSIYSAGPKDSFSLKGCESAYLSPCVAIVRGHFACKSAVGKLALLAFPPEQDRVTYTAGIDGGVQDNLFVENLTVSETAPLTVHFAAVKVPCRIKRPQPAYYSCQAIGLAFSSCSTKPLADEIPGKRYTFVGSDSVIRPFFDRALAFGVKQNIGAYVATVQSNADADSERWGPMDGDRWLSRQQKVQQVQISSTSGTGYRQRPKFSQENAGKVVCKRPSPTASKSSDVRYQNRQPGKPRASSHQFFSYRTRRLDPIVIESKPAMIDSQPGVPDNQPSLSSYLQGKHTKERGTENCPMPFAPTNQVLWNQPPV
ncbi:uncharacterized protein CLUP02_04173 [Colletotrichum lupini]|uniref:Uncharacterized protein n=1 Tax=Colletotrichum lupini TaxID=145971 RepID=A0A9Q8WD19_9PEZI|nr:uncharacterized protein CLUP02_04173 [Colletotrichum lupini]UQC78696.1 hypothetical protein CLUP02_04173 [Colletotrichum lupini]